MGDAGTSSRGSLNGSQVQNITLNKTIRCMMETTQRTTYGWEAELEGLGWLQSECLADSLKRQSNKKTKDKKINMQVSAFKIEKYSTYMGDAGTSSRGSLNGKVNDKK